jgi:hypothetical protein
MWSIERGKFQHGEELRAVNPVFFEDFIPELS